MTRMIVDRDLKSKLRDLREPLELCDEEGHVLAHVEPVLASLSDSELAVISQRTQGRPLKEFWAEMKGRS